jgi:hypothetical protein
MTAGGRGVYPFARKTGAFGTDSAQPLEIPRIGYTPYLS